MSKINCTYIGDGQTELTHGLSGTKIKTDTPPDNGGLGRTFSPTDLVVAALSACILSIMAKLAQRHDENFEGVRIEIEKIMAANPRRIGEIVINVFFPPAFTPEMKEKYRGTVNACPVHQSLNPAIKTTVHFN